MSLRWRLTISYITIIAITLIIAFALFALVAHPVQNRLFSTRLNEQSSYAAEQINALYNNGSSRQQVLAWIDSLTEKALHLLFVDTNNIVLADRRDLWVGIKFAPLRNNQSNPQTGIFNDPGGNQFLYTAIPVGADNKKTDGYIVAVMPSTPNFIGLIARFGGVFLVAGIMALIISLLPGLLIARSIALPLQHIATAASAVAAKDYEHRLQESGLPEIKQVATSFNMMIDRVENSQRAMRDFVSNVSHELKTPLTSIKGFSQAIMENATTDEASRHKAATIIYKEASRMTRMVEELLDLARIDSGQTVMSKVPLDLNQILINTTSHFLPQANKKQITFIKYLGKLPLVTGDGDRLTQVFINLLDNAITHTPTGGQVIVRTELTNNIPSPKKRTSDKIRSRATTMLTKRGEFVEITITDTGVGIPADDLARIFERFYQVDKSRKRKKGNTGLGLAITKEIINAHSGYIRVDSVDGEGTKFTIILPTTEADVLTIIAQRKL